MSVPETFFTVNEELSLFLLSCLFGVLIGVCYDVFRTLRLIFPHNSVLVLIEDIVFLIGYTIFLSAFSSSAARGELRFYYVIGNSLGFALYIITVGRFVVATINKLFYALKKIFFVIFFPFRSVYAFLCKKFRAKFVGSSKVIVNTIKKMKILLPSRPNLMYNKKEKTKRKSVKNVDKKTKEK